MSINFISSEDSDETRNLRTKSSNIEITTGNKTDKLIDELFQSLLQNFQKDLEESMRGSNFYSDSVDLLYYHLQKTSLNRKGGSYIDSPERLKKKKAKTNPKNSDDSCFQSTLTAALGYRNYKSHPERVSNLKPFIDQCYWKEIDFR